MGDHQIDRSQLAVVDPVRVATHKPDAVKAIGARTPGRLLDRLIRPVDADDSTGLFRQGEGQTPVAAPDIQHGLLAQRLFTYQAQERVTEKAVLCLPPFAWSIGSRDPPFLPLAHTHLFSSWCSVPVSQKCDSFGSREDTGHR